MAGSEAPAFDPGGVHLDHVPFVSASAALAALVRFDLRYSTARVNTRVSSVNTVMTKLGTTVHRSLMIPGETTPDNGNMAEMQKALSAAYLTLEGTSPKVRGLFGFPAINLVKPRAASSVCTRLGKPWSRGKGF